MIIFGGCFMADKLAMKEDLFQLAAETERYSFRLSFNIDKRKSMIQEKKKELDQRMLGVLSINHFDVPSLFASEEIWEQSKEQARGKFDNFSENQLINGFYFQELMHTYVEKNIKLINEDWYEEMIKRRRMD